MDEPAPQAPDDPSARRHDPTPTDAAAAITPTAADPVTAGDGPLLPDAAAAITPATADPVTAGDGPRLPDATPVAGVAPPTETTDAAGDGDVDGADVAATAGSARGHRQVARFRWRQRIVWFVGLLVVLGLGYVAVSVVQVWVTGRADDREPVDAIVVMGAAQFDGRPSPTLRARLDHVLELWPDDVAPLVVTTGGNQPGDRFTEAETSAAYLIERGVPEDAILLEDDGGTSYESLEGVAELLDARGLDEIVIVTDPYHALRSKLIAESLGLSANTSSTTTSVVTGTASLRRHLVEGAGVAVGRIVGFDRLDDWTN